MTVAKGNKIKRTGQLGGCYENEKSTRHDEGRFANAKLANNSKSKLFPLSTFWLSQLWPRFFCLRCNGINKSHPLPGGRKRLSTTLCALSQSPTLFRNLCNYFSSPGGCQPQQVYAELGLGARQCLEQRAWSNELNDLAPALPLCHSGPRILIWLYSLEHAFRPWCVFPFHESTSVRRETSPGTAKMNEICAPLSMRPPDDN